MKIFACSDLHFDARTAGFARFDDVEAAFDQVVSTAIERQADLFLFCGDACDPELGLDVIRANQVLIKQAKRLGNAGIPFVAIAGNHDVVEDGRGTTTLGPLAESQFGRVFETPGFMDRGDFVVLALPYPSRSFGYDPDKFVRDSSRYLVEMDAPIVVVSHLMHEGATPGDEKTDFPRGRDVFYPVDAVAALAKKTKLVSIGGHYHRRQVLNGVQIVGSLVRLTFGEEDHEPGYLAVRL